jgi:hypothetical protein
MTDFASIGIELDSRPVVEGTKALDALGEASARVEQRVRVNNGQMADTTKIMQAQADQAKAAAQANSVLGGSTAQLTLGQQQLIERFREQAATVGMSRSQLMAYQAAQLGVTEQTRDAIAAIKAHEDALKAAAKAKEDAAKSSNVLTDALKLLAAGYAALKVGEYIKDAALMAARYETLGVVLEVVGRNAGYTKTQMDAAAEGIARQGITMLESRNSAIKLVQAHVDLANASGLARIAQDAAVIGGINSSEAFDRMVNGISRGNVLILRNIGINVNLQTAYTQMAESLGKTTRELTENERVQARLNAVIERGADIAGTYEAAMGTAAKQILSMQRYTEDLKVKLGETFNEVLTVAVMALTDQLKDANNEVSELSKNGQLAEWGRDLTGIFVGVANAIDNILTGAKMAGTWAGHMKASGDIDDQFRQKYNAAPKDQRQMVRNEWAVALTEEQKQYEASQVTLAGMFDRFQRASDERMTARSTKLKADADARLKVDQDYATRAQALLIANADKSIEIQQAAQAKLAKEVYQGTPTYRDTEGREPKDKIDQADNTRLQDRLARIATEAAAEKANTEYLMRLDDMRHKAGELGDAEYYENRRNNLGVLAGVEIGMYGQELEALRAHHNSTEEEEAKNEKAIHDILDKRAAVRRKFDYDDLTMDEDARLRERALVMASDDAANKYTSSLNQQLIAIEAAIGKRQRSKSAIEAETIAIYEQAVANMQLQVSAPITGQHTEADREAAQRMLVQLQQELDLHHKIGAALHEEDTYRAQRKAADQAIADWRRAGSSIADSLSSAFGEGGKALGGMFKAYADNAARQLQLNKELKDSTRGLAADDPEAVAATDRAHREMATSQVKSYGDMADAARGFFSEGSRGYAAMDAAAKVMHSTEVALSLVKGVNAVLTQGSGDPYSAFARMAAMAAVVAALGVAISGVSGGDTTAKDRQASIGTGSVLGDAKAKSESISKSLDAIDSNTYQGLTVSMGMLDALRAIQNGISGLGNILIHTNGFTTTTAATQLGGAANLTNSWLDPMSKLIGNKLFGGAPGKIANAIFGGNVHSIDTGVMLPAMSLGQIASSGASVSQYNDTKTDGGWFSSDKYGTQTNSLGAEVNDQFTKILLGLRDGIGEAGKLLGLSGDAFNAQLNSFVVDPGKISTKDLKPAEVQAALEAALSKAGDDMAKFAIGGLQQFQKAGEGYLETLTRIANDYQTVDVVLQSLGMTCNAVGIGSVAARERLIELSGGLEKFTSNAGQFLKDFYTDQERAAALKARIDPTLAKYGLSTDGPDAMKAFRDVVVGLDATTEAGAQAYAELMQIAPAFKTVTDAAKDTANAAKEAAQSMKDAATGLLGGVDSTFSVLQSVAAREKAALQVRIDAESALIAKHKALSDALHSVSDGMRDPSQFAADRASAQAQIKAALAMAKAGALPAADSLKQALSVVSQDASSQFATFADYQRDLYGTKNDIEALAKLSDDALSVEEKSLEALQAQVKSLDDMLAREQEQLDELKGIGTTGLTLVQALEALRGAILAAQGNPIVAATKAVSDAYQSALGRAPEAAGLEYWQKQAAGGTSVSDIVAAIKRSPEAQVQSLYQSVLGRTADAGGLRYFLDSGESIDAIRAAMMRSDEYKKSHSIPGFVNGGDFMGGIRLVGELGPEVEATGASRIHSTRDIMSSLRSPSDNNAALAAEIKELRKESAEKAKMLDAALTAIAKYAMKIADYHDKADAIGTPPVRVDA